MGTSKGTDLKGRKILLGVTGGISAYKSAELSRAMIRSGAEVSVVMTRSACQFISPLTMEALTRNPVGLDMFSLTEERAIGHIERARWADLLLVAPATANYLAKAAVGIADDLLTTITLAARCPVMVAPAMNSAMWEHPTVRRNLLSLQERGVRIVPPATGELACGEEGQGRLAEIDDILKAVGDCLTGGDLKGLRILVTAGPTREPVDPVRYLSNSSSGKMGYAIARAALDRGASVLLVTGPTALEPPMGAETVQVQTAMEMLQAVSSGLDSCSWLVMAAAVADYRPAHAAATKIKKEKMERLTLELEPNPDILRTLSPKRQGRLFIGFAAETESLDRNALDKLRSKGLDLIVANDVTEAGAGFGSDYNRAVIFDADGGKAPTELIPKTVLANIILDAALARWNKGKAVLV